MKETLSYLVFVVSLGIAILIPRPDIAFLLWVFWIWVTSGIGMLVEQNSNTPYGPARASRLLTLFLGDTVLLFLISIQIFIVKVSEASGWKSGMPISDNLMWLMICVGGPAVVFFCAILIYGTIYCLFAKHTRKWDAHVMYGEELS